MKTCVIVNPNAGSVEEVEVLERTVGSALPGVELCVTRQEGDARRFAHEALEAGAGLIVAAGGDGTLNEVVNGLAADFGRARLGLIPLGTGNDFARSINVPADLDAAIGILREGRVRTLDVGGAPLGDGRPPVRNKAAGGGGGLGGGWGGAGVFLVGAGGGVLRCRGGAGV